LNVDAYDLIGITIGKTAQEGAEELPLAAGLTRAYDFAIDHAVMGRPIHPTRIQYILMLDSPATLGRFEGAQLAGPHSVDKCLMKIYTGLFEDLKANHALHLPL
jgi:hypothetical protein